MKVYLYSLIVNINNGLNVVFCICLCIYILMYKYSYPQESLIETIMVFSFMTLLFIPDDRELALMMNIKELMIKEELEVLNAIKKIINSHIKASKKERENEENN